MFKGSLLNTDGKRAGVTAGGRCGTLQYSGGGARAAWTREEGDGVKATLLVTAGRQSPEIL